MRRIRALAFLALAALGACGGVPYYEKEALGRRVMQFDDSPLENAFRSKVFSSREVSGGRAGASAGGGCGCN